MRISTLEEYGLRCLMRVACGDGENPVSAQVIADAEGLSLPYAQKILRMLTRGELIQSRRGAGGGFVLARDVAMISVGDVFRAVGHMFEADEICSRHTGEFPECSHAGGCSIRPVWAHLESFVTRLLDGLSVGVLLDGSDAVELQLQHIAPFPRELYCPVGDRTEPVRAPLEG